MSAFARHAYIISYEQSFPDKKYHSIILRIPKRSLALFSCIFSLIATSLSMPSVSAEGIRPILPSTKTYEQSRSVEHSPIHW